MLRNEQEQGKKLSSIPKRLGNVGSSDKTEYRKWLSVTGNLIRKKGKCITK